MRRAIIVVALVLAGCSSGAAPAATPTAKTAADAGTAEAAAEACPSRGNTAECVNMYVQMASSGVAAALCVWPDYTWSFVTPESDYYVGYYGCGQDGGGQVTAILGDPASVPDEEEPSPDVSGLGVITFGTGLDEEAFEVTGETGRFKRTYRNIAWVAELDRAVGSETLEWVVARQLKGGAEEVLYREEIPVSDPNHSAFANELDLAFLLDNQAGKYVMRYLVGGEIAAEGEFELVK